LILLDGVHFGEFTPADKAYLEKFTSATTLSLSKTGLYSLKNLPVMPNLETLDLSDNALTGDDLSSLNPAFKNMRDLKIANNSIRSLEHVAQLSKAANLHSLDLSANPVTEQHKYRENVFERLPTRLEALDGFDRDGSEWSLQDPGELVYDEGDNMQRNEVIEQKYYHDHFYLMRKDGTSSSGSAEEDVEEKKFSSAAE